MLNIYDAAERVSVGFAFVAALAVAHPSFAERMGDIRLTPLQSPAGPSSAQPNLSTASGGRIILSWLESVGKGHALRIAVRAPGKPWSPPLEVVRGQGLVANGVPSVSTHSDGSLWAHWLVGKGEQRYPFDIKIARSPDFGKTWSEAIVPYREGTQGQPGLVSFIPLNDAMGVVWLDSRSLFGNSGHDSKTAGTALMFTTIERNGKLGEEVVLDPRVCDFCPTAAVAAGGGAVIAYRDRSPDELRDISIVRRDNGKWSAPLEVTRDGWKVVGCPVNGPALDASGQDVVMAWYTAPVLTSFNSLFSRVVAPIASFLYPASAPRVAVAFSKDGGHSFGPPISVDDGRPFGRPVVMRLPDGGALVSWLERKGGSAQVLVRRIEPGGTKGPAVLVTDTTAVPRYRGSPRMARSGSEVVFAWSGDGKPSRVRTAVLDLSVSK